MEVQSHANPAAESPLDTDSRVALYRAMRTARVVEERIAEGWTDEEIVSYLEDRFAGIRLDPQFSGVTALLWLLPIAAVAGGVVLARSRTVRSEA